MTPGLSRAALRLLPAAAVLAAVVAMAMLRGSGFEAAYRAILTAWGVRPFALPFFDVAGSLAAFDCARLGFDVIATNPCDLLQRVHIYSPLLLVLAHTPLGQAQTLPAGFVLAAGFILSLAALPPAGDAAELVQRIAACLSTAVAFAIERANLDLLLFALLVCAALVLARGARWRWVGYGLVLLAAALKYYPAVAMLLVLREPPARLLRVTLVGTAILVVFVLVYGRDSVRTLAHVPRGVPFGDMFGAGNLPFGLFHTLSRAMPGVGAARATALAMLVLVVSLLAAAIGLWRRAGLAPAVARLDPERQTVLMTGALVMIGCFFSAQNIGYRSVYFLLVLPGLAALGRDQGCPAGPLMRAAAWLAVALMWEQALRRGLAAGMAALGVPNSVFAGLQFDAWVAKELGYWGLVLLFGVLVLAWLARAPLRAAWQRRHATA